VTDRCNLRCVYCMPEAGVTLTAHQDILSYEEIHRLARAAAELGIGRIRITGGEPLVRAGTAELVRLLRGIDGIDDISLTTNGILLARQADELKAAGLDRVNVSLDTLNPEKFRKITRGNAEIDEVLNGMRAAAEAGLNPVKINVVALAGVNDDEVLDFARMTLDPGWHVRFIEHMPFYGSNGHKDGFLSSHAIKEKLWELGKMIPYHHAAGNGPAKYYAFSGAKGSIGFINAVSEHFCFQCNRLRLTADGKLRTCLMSEVETDLRGPLRDGVSDDALKAIISDAVAHKPLRHHLDQDRDEETRRPFSQVGG
jgi:cyclic pyranopterin phosphate synthase